VKACHSFNGNHFDTDMLKDPKTGWAKLKSKPGNFIKSKVNGLVGKGVEMFSKNSKFVKLDKETEIQYAAEKWFPIIKELLV